MHAQLFRYHHRFEGKVVYSTVEWDIIDCIFESSSLIAHAKGLIYPEAGRDHYSDYLSSLVASYFVFYIF